jgi:hypothetical protein
MKRVALGGIALALALSSCQMEMGAGAKLRRDGSGTFTLAIAVDKEFIDGIEQADRSSGGRITGSGIKGFDDFFDSLKRQGWHTKRTATKNGDVALSGACDFPDPKAFGRCLSQISSAEGGGGGIQFKDAGLAFDLGTKQGFFKTHTFFKGVVNLAGNAGALTQQIRAVAAQVFTFEVRAELPGSVRITSGGGQIRDGVATWKPRVGERLELAAESDAYNPAALVAVAVPILILIGLGAWFLARRRPAPASGDGFTGGFGAPVPALDREGSA